MPCISRQLTKEQPVSVLLNRLESQGVVVYTDTAVALDRILSIALEVPQRCVHLTRTLPSPRPRHPILQVLIRGRATVCALASQHHPHQDRHPEQPEAHNGE